MQSWRQRCLLSTGKKKSDIIPFIWPRRGVSAEFIDEHDHELFKNQSKQSGEQIIPLLWCLCWRCKFAFTLQMSLPGHHDSYVEVDGLVTTSDSVFVIECKTCPRATSMFNGPEGEQESPGAPKQLQEKLNKIKWALLSQIFMSPGLGWCIYLHSRITHLCCKYSYGRQQWSFSHIFRSPVR